MADPASRTTRLWFAVDLNGASTESPPHHRGGQPDERQFGRYHLGAVSTLWLCAVDDVDAGAARSTVLLRIVRLRTGARPGVRCRPRFQHTWWLCFIDDIDVTRLLPPRRLDRWCVVNGLWSSVGAGRQFQQSL